MEGRIEAANNNCGRLFLTPIDQDPCAQADGHDAPRLIDEAVPCVVAVIDDVVLISEHPAGEPVVAHEAHHVHRPARMGAWVLVNRIWYYLTRRGQHQTCFALRGGARASGASRLSAHLATPRGMVPDRMARGRTRADEILSVHTARKHYPASSGERHQAVLADRTGLPGPQTGTWAQPLRGARVTWLSPSRHAVHRRLRIPPLRKGSNSPLRTTQRRSFQRTSPTQRLSTTRIPRSGLSVTSRTP